MFASTDERCGFNLPRLASEKSPEFTLGFIPWVTLGRIYFSTYPCLHPSSGVHNLKCLAGREGCAEFCAVCLLPVLLAFLHFNSYILRSHGIVKIQLE